MSLEQINVVGNRGPVKRILRELFEGRVALSRIGQDEPGGVPDISPLEFGLGISVAASAQPPSSRSQAAPAAPSPEGAVRPPAPEGWNRIAPSLP
jgi:hypothetical protein